MKQLPNGIYIAGNSVMHRLDVTVKMLLLILLIAAVISTNSPIGYLILFLFTAVLCVIAKIGIKAALGNVLRLYWFFITIFLMNLLFFKAENAWVRFWIFNPSFDGMMQGIKVVARVIAFLIFSNIVNATTPPVEITSAIENLISPLKIFRVPVSQLALIISVSIQFIPILFEEADMIKKAQIARGARFESKRLLDKAKAVMPMVVPIFVAAFRRADELSLAMEARGYRVDVKFSKHKAVHIGILEIVSVMLCAALLVVQLIVF
ncbi:MAG: energy-coupling factor transporter transmembrane protein EcfT [Eubacterium sp.]|nr:energy-coupling factor transporter transmembrane protein EcfT [Eubacterium sp.]